MSLGLSATSQVSQSVTNTQNTQAEPLTPPYSETFADESFLESYTIIDSNQDILNLVQHKFPTTPN